jgi:hypothetical protein
MSCVVQARSGLGGCLDWPPHYADIVSMLFLWHTIIALR